MQNLNRIKSNQWRS